MPNLRNGSKGGFEPGLSRLRVRHSTTELLRSTVQPVKHLGRILTSDLSDEKDIMHQTSMYNRKANEVLSDFKHISGHLRVKSVQSYSSRFYRSQLWDLSNECIDRLSIAWRKSIRKALNIPDRTHSV